ncbi:MAG: NUDIX hydrolase [Calditrichaeota bacterium]|nr:NUDIX hydrolase [Calditrichota bacterium]MCB9366763.1 NUDIX hydrolase [Calditrichota bacterium]MCB9391916.1 NUDIX hydrolase [Calditrichota bacterium]
MELISDCPSCNARVTTYKNPFPTADVVCIRENKVLLILRRNPPAGWALPGGFIDYGESAEDAAIRELREETGLVAGPLKLVGVYSKPGRDPRFHTLTVVYKSSATGDLQAGDDAAEACWFDLGALPDQIAFDHRQIISDAKRV